MLAPELADTALGFDPSLFSFLRQIEDEHFWFVARNALIAGLVVRHFPAASDLLEVGCGNGAVLRALAALRGWRRLVGSDLHPTGLANARANLPEAVELVQLNATNIPARDAFDLIGAFDVLEHLVDDEAALRQFHAALRPGGGVIVAAPQHPSLWSRSDEAASHQRRYRRGELEAKLARAGFSVVFSASFVSLLLPAMMLSRLAPHRHADGPACELAVAPLLNRLFKTVLGFEVMLTLRGVRWPVGGSRVVVARRV